jgi:hypothetical protein
MTAHPLLDSVRAHARARRSRDGAALAPPSPRSSDAAAGALLLDEEPATPRARAHLDRTIQANRAAAASSAPERHVVVEREGVESSEADAYAQSHEQPAAPPTDEKAHSFASGPRHERDEAFADFLIERTFRVCRRMSRTPQTPDAPHDKA